MTDSFTQPPKVIIDTDPGIDDCAAILFALGLEKMGLLKLLALTTVAGNVPLKYSQKNARIICDWAHRSDIPVYAGSAEPIIKPLITADDVHGSTGLGDATLHEPYTHLQEQSAITFLTNTLVNAPKNSITLCAIGPLTNIALALKTNPDCKQGIKELVIMGGSYLTLGNITPNAEFNFFIDPIASKIILESELPIRIFPLDITHKVCITTPRINQLRQLPNQNGSRIANLLQNYSRYDIEKLGLEGGSLHDPCTIGYIAKPDLFTAKSIFADIETNHGLMEGAMQVDWNQKLNKKPNVDWFYKVKTDAFFDLFTQAISRLP
ncbi:MAG: nucleoside hydrolase [Neisseriaceae bacterium]|nr:MAG: nucleoside hydrolase [Neisseriaceae bacterium]